MSVLRTLFGPSEQEIWRQLSAQMGGEFVAGGFWKGNKLQVKVKDWTITLDKYVVSTGKVTITYTRFRAPYVNKDGFRFSIHRANFFTGIGEMLGMHDIQIGEPEFDKAFVLKGNNPAQVRALFSHPPLRRLLEQQKEVQLSVKDDEGWFGADFPEGVDELYFVCHYTKDPERLKSLFELFAVTLHYLCHIGSAYEDDPKLKL